MTFSFKIGGKEFSFGTKSLSPPAQSFLNGTDVDDAGRGAVMSTPYAQSAWVYCAVSILAQTVAQIPFRISRVAGGRAKKVRALRGSGDPRHLAFSRKALGEDIVDCGDVVDLFNQPHPTMDAQTFFEMLVSWMMLRGEFFVLPLDAADQPVDLSERNPRVQRLLTLNPEMFWHVVQGFDLVAWRYTGSPLMSPLPSEMLVPSEVVVSKLPNPYLFWRGLSPLTTAMPAAQTDFAGAQYLKGLWLNNADTGVIVTTDQILADDQRRAIESALRERKRKAGTPDRPLFLFGGAKVEKPTLSMLDMQFIATRDFLRQEIFAIFKVPQTLAGFTADLNDGGAGGSLDAQKASFIESTIGGLCARIETAFARVVKTFGDDLVGWFDIDSLPIMQAARRARWDTGSKMFAMGVPINDVNENLDLGLPEYPWGGKSFLPFNLQEVSADGLANAALPSETAPADGGQMPMDETGDAAKAFGVMGRILGEGRQSETSNIEHSTFNIEPKAKPTAAAALWRKRMNFRQAHVNLFKGKIGKVLMKFRGKALAKLDDVHLQKDAGRLAWDVAGVPAAQARGLVDILFSHLAFGEALNAELETPITSTLQAAGENMLSEIGFQPVGSSPEGHDDPWKYPPKKVLEYLASRTQPIRDSGETIRNRLNTSLVEGVTNGETHLQLAGRVKAVFTDLADSEAKVIARTEVNSASTKAAFDAMVDAGIEYKSWLGSHGPHYRLGHQSVEDATIDAPIPVDQPFDVPDEAGIVDQMMQPLDDSLGAGPGNIINCQCDVLAAQKISEDEKSRTFKIFGVGEMKFSKKGFKP